MCLFSSKAKTSSSQTTTSTTNASQTNLNSSGNSGTSSVAGGNSTVSSNNTITCNSRKNTCNVTNSGNTTVTIGTCSGVITQALACETALAGGGLRTIACLSKSLAYDLQCGEVSAWDSASGLATCLVKSDQKFAAQSICSIARLACQDNQAIACLAAKNQTSNNTLLSAVAGTLSGIATANDTTQAAQSTAFAENALKIAAVVVLGLGAIAVIYAVSKK
jgi:hypothetical protein